MRLLPAGLLTVATLLSASARADEPIDLRETWSGGYDFFATGAPLAVDGPDPGTEADALAQPASAEITDQDATPGAEVASAYLYWGGSIAEGSCDSQSFDDEVSFTAPLAGPEQVIAELCYCSDAGAMSYDMQLCRADVSSLVTEVIGTYTVDGFDALIENYATNNASFSIVVVYSHEFLPPRRIGLYDGLQTMVDSEITLTLDKLDVDNPPEGDLTWYVLEGDVGGSMNEQVSIRGLPGDKSAVLSDMLNPPDNPMNGTINAATPPQSDAIGVDIDRFGVADALTVGDNAVELTYTAGMDKWWIAYNIVGINVFKAVLMTASNKTWELLADADMDGEPSPGDTVRYTVHLENTGTSPGVVVLTDTIPPEAESFEVVDDGGVTPEVQGKDLTFDAFALDPGAATDVVIDVVIAQVADEAEMVNTASFNASPDGDQGDLVAAPVIIRVDSDGDTVYDNDDNCVDTPNTDQADGDDDGVGDACDDGGTGTGTTTDPSTTDPSTTAGTGTSDSGSGTGTGSDPTGEPSTTGSDAGTGGGSGGDSDSGAGAGADEEGCGCRTDGTGAGGLAVLLLAGLRRRRRGARPPSRP